MEVGVAQGLDLVEIETKIDEDQPVDIALHVQRPLPGFDAGDTDHTGLRFGQDSLGPTNDLGAVPTSDVPTAIRIVRGARCELRSGRVRLIVELDSTFTSDWATLSSPRSARLTVATDTPAAGDLDRHVGRGVGHGSSRRTGENSMRRCDVGPRVRPPVGRCC